jgi:serine phosphatase RsbU (regulator of sigma subunit)
MIEQITNIGEQLYVNASERDEFRCLMKDQGKVQNFEFPAYRQDHSIIWAQMDARAVRDRQGQIAYYEGIVQDISDRKRQKEILEAMVKERTTELATANEAIVALNEKLKEDNLRMGAELDIVRQMQQMILPNPEELEIDGLDIAGYMDAADEVGGDYYDVLNTDAVVTLGIGDVTGHGLESGILMLMAQTAVRTLKEIHETDPVRFLDALNRTLYKNVQRMNSDKTLTLAILNYSQGRVSISGQHEETIIVRNGGQVERIDTMDLGFPIALDDESAEFISHISLELQLGDGIVLYTDGIPEAKDINKKQYGLEQLCGIISQNWHLSAPEIKQAVIDDLRRHIGTQKVLDDITLLVVKRTQLGVEKKSQPQAAALV